MPGSQKGLTCVSGRVPPNSVTNQELPSRYVTTQRREKLQLGDLTSATAVTLVNYLVLCS